MTDDTVQEGEIVPEQTGLATLSDIQKAIADAEAMAKALDALRSLMIKRTVPGDWIAFGKTVYLEGDGALRVTQLIGLQIRHIRLIENPKESGAVEVTYRMDFGSKLFGTVFPDVERTRSQDDDFLMKDDHWADLSDVRAAAYKGCIARGVQLVTGLSGLSIEEMKDRFGFDVSSSSAVQFKSTKADAKRADQASAADGQKEVARLLRKVFTGNDKEAGDWLEMATSKKGPGGWPGKRDCNKLTDANVKWVLPKLLQMEASFDKEIAESEGGGE